MKRWSILSGLGLLTGSALLLWSIGILSAPLARDRAFAEQQAVMARLLPGSKVFLQENSDQYENVQALFRGESGFVVETSVEGYAAPITLWVGVDKTGRVTGLTVRDMAETFGLGRRAARDTDFLSQFLGTNGFAAIGQDVDTLSGATVTSKAVAKAVNSASAVVTGVDVSSGATEWEH